MIMTSLCLDEGAWGGKELTPPFFLPLSFITPEGDGLYSVLVIRGPCKAVQCAKYLSYILVLSLFPS